MDRQLAREEHRRLVVDDPDFGRLLDLSNPLHYRLQYAGSQMAEWLATIIFAH